MARLHTDFATLVDYLRRDNWLAPCTALLTGTGVVPGDDFSLKSGDVIEISSSAIGTLRNHCALAADLIAPPTWS